MNTEITENCQCDGQTFVNSDCSEEYNCKLTEKNEYVVCTRNCPNGLKFVWDSTSSKCLSISSHCLGDAKSSCPSKPVHCGCNLQRLVLNGCTEIYDCKTKTSITCKYGVNLFAMNLDCNNGSQIVKSCPGDLAIGKCPFQEFFHYAGIEVNNEAVRENIKEYDLWFWPFGS